MKIKRDFRYDPSLALYLPLYKLDGTSFRSGDQYGHLCTAINGPIWRKQGRYFDGSNDYIDCGAASILNITGNITVIVWLKIATLSSDVGAPQYILCKGYTNTPAFRTYGFRVHSTGDVLNYLTGAGDNQVMGSKALNTRDFFHAASTRNTTLSPALTTLFLNGNIDATGTTPDTIADKPNDKLSIGTSLNAALATSGLLIGTISEVYIYDRDMTPAEVQQHYIQTRWRYQ